MSDPDATEVQFGISVDEVEPVVYFCVINPDRSLTRLAMNRDQTYRTAELLIDAITTIDARATERTALDALFTLQTEGPEHDHPNRP